jgi:uncharacterized protein YrzB (UPF0473 family)
MEKNMNNVLLFTGKDGSQMVFKVLFTYHSDNFNKDYAVFYNEKDENHLIAYSFDENKTLSSLESDEEYAELEEALKKYDEENI